MLPVARGLGPAARRARPHRRRRDRAAAVARRRCTSDLAAGRPPDHDFSAALPLLRQLARVERLRRRPAAPDAASVQDGLATLATIAHTRRRPGRRARAAAARGGLDARRTGSTPGTRGSPRRGWRTSARPQPDGIQVGAYGWLEDVQAPAARGVPGLRARPVARARRRPRRSCAAAGRRFGGDAESAGLAVDLSSDRIRRARWLIDGVRNGQDLGRAARRAPRAPPARRGPRRRRSRTCARLALRAAGSTAPPTAIVDGLLRRPRPRLPGGAPDERDGYTAAEVAAADELDGLLADAKLSAAERARLERRAGRRSRRPRRDRRRRRRPERLLARRGQRARGDDHADRGRDRRADLPARCASPTGAARDHDHPPAAPARRPGRDGRLAGRRARAAGRSRRRRSRRGSRACSATRRATARHPLPGSRHGRGGRAGRSTRTLADVGPRGARRGRPRAGRRGDRASVGSARVLAGWAEGRRPAGPRPERSPSSSTPASATRRSTISPSPAARCGRLLDDARDLDGRDLAAPGATDAASGLDTAELEAPRRRGAQGARDGGAPRSPPPTAAGARRPPRRRCSPARGFAAPRRRAARQRPGDARRAGRRAARGRSTAASPSSTRGRRARPTAGTALDDVARYRALRDRLQLLVGHSLPLAPQFAAGRRRRARRHASRARGFARRPRRRDGSPPPDRVDPGARRLRVATDLAEALARRRAFGFALGQLPDHPGRGLGRRSRGRPPTTAAASACSPTGARAVVRAAPPPGSSSAPGPRRSRRCARTAALGVHFDSPAARAPQAILLCTADAEDGFSFELVRDLLLQTLELAKLRLAGPQTLGELGQYLPATYLQTAPSRRERHDLAAARVHDDRRQPDRGTEAARIADPLWLLGRQWQVGRVHGRGRGEPARRRGHRSSHAPLTRVRLGPPDAGGPVRRPARAAARDGGRARGRRATGPAAPRLAAEAGLELRRELAAAGAPAELVDARCRHAFPLALGPDDGLDPVGRAELELLARRAPDARAVLADLAARRRRRGRAARRGRGARPRFDAWADWYADWCAEPPAGRRLVGPAADGVPLPGRGRRRRRATSSSSTPPSTPAAASTGTASTWPRPARRPWAPAASSQQHATSACCRRRRGSPARPRRAGGSSRTPPSGSATSAPRPRTSRASPSPASARCSATTGTWSRAGCRPACSSAPTRSRCSTASARPTSSARAPSSTARTASGASSSSPATARPTPRELARTGDVPVAAPRRQRSPGVTQSRADRGGRAAARRGRQPGLGGRAADRERGRAHDRPRRARPRGADAARRRPPTTPGATGSRRRSPTTWCRSCPCARSPTAACTSSADGRGRRRARPPAPLGRVLEPDSALLIVDDEVPATGARVTRSWQLARTGRRRRRRCGSAGARTPARPGARRACASTS